MICDSARWYLLHAHAILTCTEFTPVFFANRHHQFFKQFINTGIIELRGNSSHYGQFLIFGRPKTMIPFVLFPHIVQGIQCPAFIEFIDAITSA